MPLTQVGIDLDVHPNGLRRWMDQFSEEHSTFKPVELLEERSGRGGGIAIVTPSGLRVEGLDAESAVMLVERLS